MSFIFSYLSWHYSKAFLNIYGIFSNFFWMIYRFFSLPLLFKTFFSPWRHLDDQYTKKLDIQEFFSTLIVNTLMRLVGMFFKLVVILVAIVFIIVMSVVEAVTFLVWLLLPVVIVWLIYSGITKIF
ncbi:MAG: hypothetical protein A2566_02675 [Candidatus Zambryskibacteria bacterium RIFOXYD1_FULL_40_13]|nr:MAG: hypothetical protein A2123_03060 [Candidatus Zambryskibacteria bacterium GWB1_40_5]OHB15046.1 MAG: hypothetical protein A2566_02675 [Candidatus Zambryskibacteria bacterium RIFOXYD1_FULL_40_13]HBD24602.1 hypothetical protein [Candidatus Zambryskibacteria bacterium]HBO17433.1 hypothetical protein [Candidatus Zambryskibacteria bacterium]HBZ04230.1 hypothetical protein [Candidatus Zambryskibacteria bacterium]